MFNLMIPSARTRKLIAIGLVTFFASFWIHGCSNFSQKQQPLRIGISSWPGFDVVLYAQEAGLFEKRGLEVELLRFESQQDSMRAMMRGSLDAVFSSLWDTMQVDSTEDSPAFIMVTNVSNGSDGIVAVPEIKSVKDLVGKTVGVKLGGIEHLIFLEALELHGIDPKTVEIDNVLQQVGVQKVEAGQLDASVTWEPSLTQVAQKIDGNILFTTGDVKSLVIDGLVSRQNNIAAKEEELTQFMLAWFDLIHAIETQPDTVFQIVAEQLNQNPDDFAQDYAGLQKGDMALNEAMFSQGGRLEQGQKAMAELLKKDPRHGRVIREDVEINSEPVLSAIAQWQP